MHGYSTSLRKGHGCLSKALGYLLKVQRKGRYCLHGKALMGKFIALAAIHSHMELWHKRLGHMSQKDLDKLCNLDNFDAKASKLEFVMNANTISK